MCYYLFNLFWTMTLDRIFLPYWFLAPWFFHILTTKCTIRGISWLYIGWNSNRKTQLYITPFTYITHVVLVCFSSVDSIVMFTDLPDWRQRANTEADLMKNPNSNSNSKRVYLTSHSRWAHKQKLRLISVLISIEDLEENSKIGTIYGD